MVGRTICLDNVDGSWTENGMLTGTLCFLRSDGLPNCSRNVEKGYRDRTSRRPLLYISSLHSRAVTPPVGLLALMHPIASLAWIRFIFPTHSFSSKQRSLCLENVPMSRKLTSTMFGGRDVPCGILRTCMEMERTKSSSAPSCPRETTDPRFSSLPRYVRICRSHERVIPDCRDERNIRLSLGTFSVALPCSLAFSY